MVNRKFSLLIRILLATVFFAVTLTLAFYWTTAEARGVSFYYFLAIMLYAFGMLFFSDVLFLHWRKALHTSIPFNYVAAIHTVYIALIILLNFIFTNIDDVYFVLATLLATGIQIAVSLVLYQNMLKIAEQDCDIQTKKNIKTNREILLMELIDKVKRNESFSKNYELLNKLDIFYKTWAYSPEMDTENTVQITDEINDAIRSLSDAISEKDIDSETICEKLTDITSLIQRRKKMLQLK